MSLSETTVVHMTNILNKVSLRFGGQYSQEGQESGHWRQAGPFSLSSHVLGVTAVREFQPDLGRRESGLTGRRSTVHSPQSTLLSLVLEDLQSALAPQ